MLALTKRAADMWQGICNITGDVQYVALGASIIVNDSSSYH